jgi:hypothetical protein
VFKNAIDWMTRPPSDVPRIFRGRTLGMRPWFGQLLYVGNAAKVFDASGRIHGSSGSEPELDFYVQ